MAQFLCWSSADSESVVEITTLHDTANKQICLLSTFIGISRLFYRVMFDSSFSSLSRIKVDQNKINET